MKPRVRGKMVLLGEGEIDWERAWENRAWKTSVSLFEPDNRRYKLFHGDGDKDWTWDIDYGAKARYRGLKYGNKELKGQRVRLYAEIIPQGRGK